MAEFAPILYLKSSCPFCLKVATYLASIGEFADMEIRAFWPDDPEDEVIRKELEGKTEKVSFPTLQFAPGEYMIESDAIIERYRQKSGIDPESLPFYQYVINGPMRRMREQFAEIKRLNGIVEENVQT
ncbi:glutathione S-transferase N-terminal domain-containing protein [Aurantiacibacter flavus]|uniref:Glutathione S-transferase N-terminal domain-containing protein n=1 Tax=Aurantiacibacter flavus TaxID=3145232 RepID=A0ABV0CZG4_9SPHN